MNHFTLSLIFSRLFRTLSITAHSTNINTLSHSSLLSHLVTENLNTEENNSHQISQISLGSNKIAMALIPQIFGQRSNIFDPFSLDIWDPFQGWPLDTSRGDQSRQPSGAVSEVSALASARVDWKETADAHVFKVDLPGVKKEEVKVEVEEGRVLQISGERSKEQEEKNDKWHRVERSSGKFLRRFRLPENAKLDQVKATMENGVLTVMVPKEEVKKPEVKAIEISG